MPIVPETDFPNLTGDYKVQSTQLTPVRVGILWLGPSFYLGHSLLVKINPAKLRLTILLLLFLFSAFFSYFSSSSSSPSWHQCLKKVQLQIYMLSFFWWYKRIRIWLDIMKLFFDEPFRNCVWNGNFMVKDETICSQD